MMFDNLNVSREVKQALLIIKIYYLNGIRQLI